MNDVYVLGVAQTPVRKQADETATTLGARAVQQALQSTGGPTPGALYVGNMMSGILSHQLQLGAHIADAAGLRGIEAATVEAACASGSAAARWAYMAVASGIHGVAIACGVERMAHVDRDLAVQGLATASDWQLEGGQGKTFMTLNASLMQSYMDRHRVGADAFAPFAVNAHDNALSNDNALFHKKVSLDTYNAAQPIEGPVRLYDASPICDGAAAIVFGDEAAFEAMHGKNAPRVRVAASAVGTDSLALVDRADPLVLQAAVDSSQRAYQQSGLAPADIDLFEVHDAYTIMSVLSLEAAGFAQRGHGARLGHEGEIRPDGSIPITTLGGLKGRGHPVGATGIYQLAEAHAQLMGSAGASQVPNARVAMAQNFGGTAATVVTHILERVA